MRHRAHRHHRAHGEGAGAEVGQVGRPARCPPSRARTSVSRSGVSSRADASARTVANSRCTWPDCHASSRSTRVRLATPSASAASQSASRRVPVRASVATVSRSTNSASRPASSTRLLPTSSSGSVVPSQACESSEHHSREHPVHPELPGVLQELLEAERRAVLLVEAPAPPTPGPTRSRWPGRRRRSRTAGAPAPPARGRARRWPWRGCRPGPAAGPRPQQRVGLGERPVGQPDPEPVGGVTPSRTSPRPKPAVMSGA